jgi:hypothetical protein
MIIRIYTLLIIAMLCLACSGKTERKFVDTVDQFMLDGEPELYRFVMNELQPKTVDSLCTVEGHVVCDLTLSIRENEFSEVRFNGAYLIDESGNIAGGSHKFGEFRSMLNKMTIEQFPRFRDSTEGHYGIKVDFQKICEKK